MFKNNSFYFLKKILILIIIALLLISIESYSVQASCSPVMDSSVTEIKDLLGIVAEDQLRGEELDGIGMSSKTIDSLISILKNWHDKSITLRLKESKTNERELNCAVNEFFTWYYYVQSLGFEEYFENEISTSLYDNILPGIKNAIKKSYDRCLQHDLSGIDMILSYYALGLQIGLEDDLYSWEDIMEIVRRAAVFELEFKSTSKLVGFSEFKVNSNRIKLEIDDEQEDLLGGFIWSGKGELNYKSIKCYMEDVDISLYKDGSLEIPAAWIYLPKADLRCDKCKNTNDNLNQNSLVTPDNVFHLMPEQNKEKITAHIGGGKTMSVVTPGWFALYYLCYQDTLHKAEGYKGYYVIDKWEINNLNELYAVKETARTMEELYATNSLKLYHVPSKYDFE